MQPNGPLQQLKILARRFASAARFDSATRSASAARSASATRCTSAARIVPALSQRSAGPHSGKCLAVQVSIQITFLAAPMAHAQAKDEVAHDIAHALPAERLRG